MESFEIKHDISEILGLHWKYKQWEDEIYLSDIGATLSKCKHPNFGAMIDALIPKM